MSNDGLDKATAELAKLKAGVERLTMEHELTKHSQSALVNQLMGIIAALEWDANRETD